MGLINRLSKLTSVNMPTLNFINQKLDILHKRKESRLANMEQFKDRQRRRLEHLERKALEAEIMVLRAQKRKRSQDKGDGSVGRPRVGSISSPMPSNLRPE